MSLISAQAGSTLPRQQLGRHCRGARAHTGPHRDAPQHGRHLSAKEQAVGIDKLQAGVAARGTLRRVLSEEAVHDSRGRGAGLDKGSPLCAQEAGLAAGSGLPRHPSSENGSLQSLALSNLLEPEEHRGSDTRITQDDGMQKQDLPWERPLPTRSRPGRPMASGRRAEARRSPPSPPPGDRLSKRAGQRLSEAKAHTPLMQEQRAVGKGRACRVAHLGSWSCINLRIIISVRQDCSHSPRRFQ